MERIVWWTQKCILGTDLLSLSCFITILFFRQIKSLTRSWAKTSMGYLCRYGAMPDAVGFVFSCDFESFRMGYFKLFSPALLLGCWFSLPQSLKLILHSDTNFRWVLLDLFTTAFNILTDVLRSAMVIASQAAWIQCRWHQKLFACLPSPHE